MNNSTYNKVAVVTSAATVIGVSVIEKLAEQGYLVFACLDGRPESSKNLDSVRHLPNVKTIYTEISSSSAWTRIGNSIARICSEYGLEPAVDVLVNIPTFDKVDSYASIPEYKLEVTLRETLLKTYGAVQVLTPLLKVSAEANIVNIYPAGYQDYTNDLVAAIATGALDSFTVSLAATMSENNINVNAVRPSVFAGHGLYETTTLANVGTSWVTQIVQTINNILASSQTGHLFTVTSETSTFESVVVSND